MFEGILQPTHLLLILLIVLLMFGPQKLPQVGRGLGEAIRGFREGLKSPASSKQGEAGEAAPPAQQSLPTTDDKTASAPPP